MTHINQIKWHFSAQVLNLQQSELAKSRLMKWEFPRYDMWEVKESDILISRL
jgi:hypothetical protein